VNGLKESLCARARKYIDGLKAALNRISNMEIGERFRELIDAVTRYTRDSEYFLDKGDCESALVAVSYAEGLLDSLRYMGITGIAWEPKPEPPKKVLVAGTFDLLHPGHIELLRYASTLGKLYVIVSRDINAERVKRRPLILDENSRLRLVSAVRYVYSARLGSRTDILEPLKEIKPDIVVLGPDQPYDEEELANMIQAKLGFKPSVIRFREKISFSKGMVSTTDIIKRICNNLCEYIK
jgi:FAD synthetase